jgi:hypothetical protein
MKKINNIIELEPDKFPVSIKCLDVLNVKDRLDVIHTFNNKEEFEHWKNLVIEWDNMGKSKKEKEGYLLLDEVVEPTLEITKYI